MIGAVVKASLLFGWALGLMLPGLVWARARQRAAVEGRLGPRAAQLEGDAYAGLLQPIASILRLLSQSDELPPRCASNAYRAAPVTAFVIPLAALAVVPFGSSYDLGRFTPNLVVADLDWGVLWLFAAALFSLYGIVLAGWASGGVWSGVGAARAGGELLSLAVPLGLSLVGLCMITGSLKPSEMVRAQDTTIAGLALLDRLGMQVGGDVAALVRLPAWGIVLQPLGFVLFLFGITLESRRSPFGGSLAEPELVGGAFTDYSGARLALLMMAQHLRLVVAACLVTTLFLGGWSIPYLSQERIIAGVAAFYGEGFATILCLVLHVSVFFTKVVLVIALWLRLESVMPRLDEDRVRALCWTALLPLALINLCLTAVVLLWLEGSA